MKIAVASDIHLEFGRNVQLPGGEVLLLAGDILTAEATDDDFRWLAAQCSKYRHVFMCDGNHTFYHGDLLNTTRWVARRLLDFNTSNLAYGDTGSLEIDGVKFVWATLWTDFADSADVMNFAQYRMNDYRLVRCGDRVATPRDVYEIHQRHRAFIVRETKNHDRVVVMTHHAPSKKSIHPQYGDDLLNACYSSDLEGVILGNPGIKLWAHGHTHHSHDYHVGQCRVVCNPRGYEGYDLNYAFKPAFEVEV